MKRNIVFTIMMIMCCFVVIWLIVALSMSAKGVYVPDIDNFDSNIDYMAKMIEAAEDGSPWAMAVGRVYEQLRNKKIDVMSLDYIKTDYFKGVDNAKEVLEKLQEYIKPKESEREFVYVGRYLITGYDICERCCGKTDGVTASGTIAAVGRTVAASAEFPFGTHLYIEGIGERIVEDRGGAIGGGRLDVLCHDHAECYEITGWYDVWLIVEG